MDEKKDIFVDALTPDKWVTIQELFIAPADTYAGSFQFGVRQPEGEKITIADAAAVLVPDGWAMGNPLPKGATNLISNPRFSGGHIIPAGWNLQSLEIGGIYPEGKPCSSGESGLCIEGSNILLYTDFPVRPGQRLLYSLRIKSSIPNPHLRVGPVWRKKLTLAGSNIEVPGPESPHMYGNTGFNSVNLQTFWSCRTFSARRSQIMHGWGKPIIQRLPNNDLITTQYKSIQDKGRRNPKYPDADEEVALCVSKNQGWTWSEPRLLDIPGRPTQFSVLSDGVIILAAGSSLFRSDNLGKTFTECPVPWDKFMHDKRPAVRKGLGETNGVTELSDGTLLIVCCTFRPPIEKYTDFNSYILRSRDRGKTWGDASFLVNTDESELLSLPDGRILAFARLDTAYTRDVWGKDDPTGEKQVNEGGDTMALMESSDGGYKWTQPAPIGLGSAQIPAFPVLLPDGRIILTYGNRQFPFGIQAIASRDQGRSWDVENFLTLAWASWSDLCGHPRSILMSDGSIITGYYAHYFKDNLDGNENHDIVSHCLKWTPPDDWPPVE